MLIPKPQKKVKAKRPKKKKLTPAKVQAIFNTAIRRRDGGCVTNDVTCKGRLECSHFFTRGGNGGLRFHPDNAHAQCSNHHFEYHNRNPLPYTRWMEEHVSIPALEALKTKTVRYTQPVLKEIVRLCDEDKLDELKEYVESLMED